jgi:hypothetical protein
MQSVIEKQEFKEDACLVPSMSFDLQTSLISTLITSEEKMFASGNNN